MSEDQRYSSVDFQYPGKDTDDNPETEVITRKYNEETSAEIGTPMALGADFQQDFIEETDTSGRVYGISALTLSLLSLFLLPVLLGAAGIILGFVARRKGANGLGGWAIGVGAVSIIIGIFVLPFF
ncbi:DUF4190 domain-containing protein [Bacillus spongiae]|uniref:DUF4190 domain-containing protein n=1 Tax=Bacillus spongiae TaxID=2683610 RepID=A0ABU8H944_9BACI